MSTGRCIRCVLPELDPEIRLDGSGICNVCRDHERRSAKAGGAEFHETDFVRLLAKYRGKGRHDCLVMCSGGKDSTASLLLMKRRYKMTPLAFTFDHGFETEDALSNVRRAVDVLGVDWVVYKSTFMKDMFRRVIESGAKVVLCHPCSIWYMQLTFETARRYKTPLIVAGWTKGQSVMEEASASGRYGGDAPEYAAMARETREFLATLRDDPTYRNFPLSMEEAVRRGRKRFRCTVQSPHWYLPDATEDHVETLRSELGWEPPRRSYPKGSTNCSLNFLSSALSLEYYGYTHYHVEMSKLIRQGLLTREEALARLEPDFDEDHLREIAAQCGCAPGTIR